MQFKEFRKLYDNVIKEDSSLKVDIDFKEYESPKFTENFLQNYIQLFQKKYSDKSITPTISKFNAFLNSLNSTSTFSPIEAKFGFEELAGLTKEKTQIKSYFIYPSIYPNLFRNKKSNLLLFGVPGTGKSLLVKASVAEVKNAAFFSPLPSQLRGKYEGETEKNIANIFQSASDYIKGSKYSRAIIFLDEIDGIAAKSSDPIQARARSALLQSMDGIASSDNISIIGATNYIKNIDDAVLRRFAAKVNVNLPDRKARKWIILDQLMKSYLYPTQFLKCSNESECFKVYDKNKESLYANLKGILHHEDITRLVEMSGPRGTHKCIKGGYDDKISNKIETQGSDKTEYSAYAMSQYGYSASDLTKVMQLAITNAAQRAIYDNARYKQQEYDGKKYYVYSPEDTKKQTSISISDISEKDYDKLITFDIHMSDFENAFKEYKYTYNIDEYLEDLKNITI